MYTYLPPDIAALLAAHETWKAEDIVLDRLFTELGAHCPRAVDRAAEWFYQAACHIPSGHAHCDALFRMYQRFSAMSAMLYRVTDYGERAAMVTR